MSEEKTKIYLGDVLISGEDINIDATPTAGSSNAVSSGGTYTAIQSAISSVYKYKGTKANYASLPSSGNVTGDVWNVEAAYGDYPAGTNWAWTGSDWDALGGEVDLSSYLTKTDASSTYATKTQLTNGSVTKLGTATVGSSTMPIYLNAGTPAAISSFPEAYLSWGGKNFTAAYGPIDAAMVSELGACRTMFAKAAGIVVEYSTDGGATWLDYGLTDSQKVGLFSSGQTVNTGKNTIAGGASPNNMLRVSLRTYAAGIYTSLNKFVLYVNTNGSSGSYCTIRCRTQQNYEDNVDTWVVRADHVGIGGWSGWNVINIDATTTYGNAKASQYGEWQFIFGYTGANASYAGLIVNKIFGFGGVGWTTPSYMASTGHLYTFDSGQNAYFPATVAPISNGLKLGYDGRRWELYATAGNFSGALTATGNTSVGGTFRVLNSGGDGYAKFLVYPSNPYGIVFKSSSNGTMTIQSQRESNDNETYPLILNPNGGNVGVGTSSPSQKLEVNGNVKATSFIKSGGTSSQFLKADGSVDSNAYATTSALGNYLPLAGGQMNQGSVIKWTDYSQLSSSKLQIPGAVLEYGKLTLVESSEGKSGGLTLDDSNLYAKHGSKTFTFPNTSGTLALTSAIPTVDATPTASSTNAVSSGGVYTALQNNETVVSAAINDLYSRIDDIESGDIVYEGDRIGSATYTDSGVVIDLGDYAQKS